MRIENNSTRPYNLAVNYKDNNGLVRSRPFHFIPGTPLEVDDDDLKELKKGPGFKRYLKRGDLKIIPSKKKKIVKEVDEDEAEISDMARQLAEENGIEIDDLTPNKYNNITVDIVKKAIKEKDDEEEVILD